MEIILNVAVRDAAGKSVTFEDIRVRDAIVKNAIEVFEELKPQLAEVIVQIYKQRGMEEE